MFGAELGWRAQRIKSAGYDPFSSDDWQGFLSVSGWFSPFARGPLSVAATAGWDFGSSASFARSQPTHLALHRLWAAPEGRLQLGDLGHVFIRVGPSVWHMRAELVDGGLSAPLVRRPWLVGADAAVGGRARVLDLRDERGTWMLGFLGLELGYAYVPTVRMDMRPKSDAVAPRDVGGVRLPDFGASGFTARLTASTSF